MNLEKAKKRIAKKVRMGFKGYPQVSISYSGHTADSAEQATVLFVAEEGDDPMEQNFQSTADARENEAIMSAIVKIIERSDAKTVTLIEGIKIVK